ncbi:MAG TPA: hypothetical protein VMH49_06370 [Thermoplasmata archaeon]|nr:hypothetical protein [Thermoplasmata archaeon]
MLALDLPVLVQTLLFLMFIDITALVNAVIGPTYDNLLVPEMAPHALYPAVLAAHPVPADYLGQAASFSSYLLTGVVDPVVALVALGIAFLYLGRTVVARWASSFDALVPRLVLAVVAANFTVPICAALLGLAGGLYPVVAGWDGGAWRQWVHLSGYGAVGLTWDNGVVAFVLSLVEFTVVFSLVLAIGLRDAVLAVLIVVLPLVTLLWPFRPLASVPRRAWLLFLELAFLPCVLVVPLELAVDSPNPVLLLGYLSAALASPFLLSIAGTHLVALGFPSASTVTQSGVGRGLAAAPAAVGGLALPAAGAARGAGAAGQALAGATRAAGGASLPLAMPAALHELLGHGASAVVRHLQPGSRAMRAPGRLPPLRPPP